MYNLGKATFPKNDAPDARHVANYLLRLAQAKEKDLTPLQMIKLVYYCHGWHLGIHRKPLIRQNVEAWQYGPVIAIVYHQLKHYRRDPITNAIRVSWLNSKESNFTETQYRVMDEVFAKYHHFSGVQLSTFTHHEGTPWHSIWTGSGQVMWETTGKNPVIPDKVIEDYFANWFQQYAHT